MSRTQWVVVIVVAGAVLAWLAVATSSRPEVSEPGTESAVQTAASPPASASEPPAPTPAAPTPQRTPQPGSAPEQPTSANEPETAGIPMPGRSGPVAELAQRYASEPRASSSVASESIIEAQFRRPEVPAGLLQSALCRTSVCRIETRWSPERAQGFMSALMHLVTDQSGFDHQIAIDPQGEAAADGSHALDVYVRLLPAQ